jgi:NAD(P)-dependent dehydrogenase (short-subunit alcohol dehydrogenase family)
MRLKGKLAWVTGAGSGIGEAAALALAAEGASLVLTGRARAKLDRVAALIRDQGGVAHVQPADVTRAAEVQAVADFITATPGRIDILVNNAGLNIRERSWETLTASGVDAVVHGNLSSAFYCVIAVLPLMRAQKDGVLIHTSSWSGRFVGPLSGAAYTAAKHGVVAMSHSLNLAECVNGIRSTVFCPGEVATPILDGRPNPPSAEVRAQMLQADDCGDLIRYIACLPPHVCLNEVVMSPTWNRGYVAQRQHKLA